MSEDIDFSQSYDTSRPPGPDKPGLHDKFLRIRFHAEAKEALGQVHARHCEFLLIRRLN